jgi:hypothetical protein
VEAVSPGALTATESKPDDPNNGEDDRSDPQEMHGESQTEQDQNEQECQ